MLRPSKKGLKHEIKQKKMPFSMAYTVVKCIEEYKLEKY
jgi:hypothetical protein